MNTNETQKRGPGRPRRETPRIAFTVRVEPETAAKIRSLCDARKVSQSKLITELVGGAL